MDPVYHDMHHKVSGAGVVGVVTGGVLLRSCWLCSGCVFRQPRCVAAAGWVCVCGGGVFFQDFYSDRWPHMCPAVSSCWEMLTGGGGRCLARRTL